MKSEAFLTKTEHSEKDRCNSNLIVDQYTGTNFLYLRSLVLIHQPLLYPTLLLFTNTQRDHQLRKGSSVTKWGLCFHYLPQQNVR